MLSRTDSIGDVVLTLPMAGVIKKHFPQSKVIFLGRTYTRDVITLSTHVDEFVDYDDLKGRSPKEQAAIVRQLAPDILVHVFPQKDIARLGRKAGVPCRVGTTNRLFHWFTCNKLISLSRKRSDLHEAQLNLKLLSFLDIPVNLNTTDIPLYYGFNAAMALPANIAALLESSRKKVILHPKSKGSAREWGTEKFSALVKSMPADRYQVIIGGTAEDKKQLTAFLAENPGCLDLAGKLTLKEYIALINAADALVAASTGPLHIAAALGKKAIGLFSSRRPIHPGRWKPLGIDAHFVVYDKNCPDCAAGKNCDCISRIDPAIVINLLQDETV